MKRIGSGKKLYGRMYPAAVIAAAVLLTACGAAGGTLPEPVASDTVSDTAVSAPETADAGREEAAAQTSETEPSGEQTSADTASGEDGGAQSGADAQADPERGTDAGQEAKEESDTGENAQEHASGSEATDPDGESAEEPATGEETGKDNTEGAEETVSAEAWKSAYLEVIAALEEQGSGVCVIDPNHPDGHRCGYDYCLFYAQEDPVPELYYVSVVSTLGEGIYRFADGRATERGADTDCASVLGGASGILCEGDAQTLTIFLQTVK